MSECFFITGAARGLGLAMTRQLLERGDQVSVLVRKPSAAIEGLQERHGAALSVHTGDVTDVTSLDRAFAVTGERLGHLDVLINNAVIYLDRPGPFEEIDFSICARTFEVNSAGPLQVAQRALPLIRRGKRKLLANISSEAGSIGDCWRKAEFAYCMSKSALNMGSRILQNYVAAEGIKVLAMHPGWFNSSGEGPAPISAEQAAVKVLATMLKEHTADGPMYLDLDGKTLPW